MTALRNRVMALAVVMVMVVCARLHAQGPPYQTDDPVPVDLHHYEFYIFGGADGTPVELDSLGPAFEFNWGGKGGAPPFSMMRRPAGRFGN